MVGISPAPTYNPAQQAVLDQLGASAADRPTFPAELREQLRADLEAQIEPVGALLDELGCTAEQPLTLNKHTLKQVHGCEVHLLAEEAAGFPGWNVARARGTVAHKAIELSVHMKGDVPPAELVDEALGRLVQADSSLGDWLQAAPAAEQAELRAVAVDRVTQFVECFPPLKAKWRPVTESTQRAELAAGRVELRGKVDLTIGTSTGTTAGKVLIDLKTGRFAPHHLDDLRFYALVELLRLGVPPRLLTTYYLDQGSSLPEEVTEAVLGAAVARVADGVVKLVELRAARREPVARAGAACRWCPVAESCEVGQAHLGAADDDW